MATAEHVRRLMDDHGKGNIPSFRRAVQQTVSDARSQGQDTLAFELETLASRAAKPDPLGVSSLRPLPMGRDDIPLVSVRSPVHRLNDLVLRSDQDQLLQEILREHRHKELLLSRGLYPRRRLLLTGPSGTGKSKTAEALAFELGLPLLVVKLSAVVSSYLGETSRNLDRVMDYADSGSWVLLFDEIDMLGADRARDDHGEMRRIVTALLQTLEESSGSNLVIATTNYPSMLDTALWRRFDEVCGYRLPTQTQIEKLLSIKLRKTKGRINRREVAKSLAGLSPAEVEMVCNDAVRASILDLRTQLQTSDLVLAAQQRRERFAQSGKFLQ